MICKKCKKNIPEGAKVCPECHSDLRNWFVRHKIISALLILIGLGIVLSAFGGDPQKTQNIDSNEVLNYVEVISIQTSSTRNSDTFKLNGGKQKITYTLDEGQFALCNVYLLDEGTDLQEQGGFPVVALAEEDGETILRKSSGSYYLSIQASNTNCAVTLEEER